MVYHWWTWLFFYTCYVYLFMCGWNFLQIYIEQKVHIFHTHANREKHTLDMLYCLYLFAHTAVSCCGYYCHWLLFIGCIYVPYTQCVYVFYSFLHPVFLCHQDNPVLHKQPLYILVSYYKKFMLHQGESPREDNGLFCSLCEIVWA